MEGQIGAGKIFQSARPAGGWHCSVSSARPYFSRGEAEVWSGLQGRMAKTKFFSQAGRPAGGWHCSVSSARPYLSRGEAEVWSGLQGRMAETKFFSQAGRPADGIAQFHPPDHTSAEARRRSGLD